jgi:pyridoxal phosphate enzyme (YggS family)
MTEVRENCLRILERIHNAAAGSGRDPGSVRLIAVTKTVSPDRIREAAACGITDAGENRVQEALPKLQALSDLPLAWHFIGHLQTNKARKVAEAFDWVQSLDRVELAEKLNQTALKTLPVLIEVKLHDEPNKSGVDPTELEAFIAQFSRYERLQLRGLMAIPPLFDNPEHARPYFRRLRELGTQFALPELSMGMSGDFEVAIEEGATMVRIGTALFGARQRL